MTRWIPTMVCMGLALMVQPWVANDPVTHVLIQMPLLAFAGAVLPRSLHRLPQDWALGVFILALCSLFIWMLPRSVDAAVNEWSGLIAKFITLPLTVGFPIAVTWPKLGPVLRGFFKAQAISMLLILAFLYTHAPLRICNSYLIDAQQRLGYGYVIVAVALVILWLIPVFTGTPLTFTKEKHHELPNHGQ